MDDQVRRAGSFFGRRIGKSLRAGQRLALAEVLPTYLIDIAAPPPEPLTQLFPPSVASVCLEIGFGGGEHLLAEAERNPTRGFIGVEPFQNGLAHLAAALQERAIGNVRLFGEDAALLLDWLPAASLARIDLLFPDPWPKRRHWKRRFVREENLARFVRVLQPNGVFRFASDVPGYVRWTREAVVRNGQLRSARPDAAEAAPYENWPGTRYEAKAIAAGRRPTYLAYAKSGEPPVSAEA
jgi:tRNA (guanine-N7-)-methyltransferase